MFFRGGQVRIHASLTAFVVYLNLSRFCVLIEAVISLRVSLGLMADVDEW